MSPGDFTREYAQALRSAQPGMKVQIVGDLELKVIGPKGNESTSFLNNAYDCYRQDPKEKDEVIRRFTAAAGEANGLVPEDVDAERIVPVIKDRPWMEETRQALAGRGAIKAVEYVYDDFCPDLVVMYAEDSPQAIRYLTPDRLEKAKIDRKDLRAMACKNLRRLLPQIERHGGNGLYMLTAGGNYEASLLLLDSIWTGGQIDVSGEIVVAIPTRDLLLVTGTQNLGGIAKVKQMVAESQKNGSYRLTSKLFVFRNGSFEAFDPGM